MERWRKVFLIWVTIETKEICQIYVDELLLSLKLERSNQITTNR